MSYSKRIEGGGIEAWLELLSTDGALPVKEEVKVGNEVLLTRSLYNHEPSMASSSVQARSSKHSTLEAAALLTFVWNFCNPASAADSAVVRMERRSMSLSKSLGAVSTSERRPRCWTPTYTLLTRADGSTPNGEGRRGPGKLGSLSFLDNYLCEVQTQCAFVQRIDLQTAPCALLF